MHDLRGHDGPFTSLARARLLVGSWSTEKAKSRLRAAFLEIGAGEGIRTLDPNLGKVVLYP